MLAVLLLSALAQDAREWTFDARVRAWIGSQSSSRARAMEIEGFGKGGTGKGTLFSYADLGADGVVVAPEIVVGATYSGNHRAEARLFFASETAEKTLGSTLEYDGDLHFAGERIESEFSTRLFDLGYLYRVKDGLFGEPLDLWIGGRAAFFIWDGTVRTESAGPTPPTDTQSNEVITGLFAPSLAAILEWSPLEALRVRADVTWLFGATSRRGVQPGENNNGYMRATLGVEAAHGGWRLDAALGYMSIDAVSFEHDDEADLVNWRMFGAVLGAGYRF